MKQPISPLALDLFFKYREDRRITNVYDINIVELVFLKVPAFFTCYKTLALLVFGCTCHAIPCSVVAEN
jgi:hypothetical protein